MDIEQRRAQFLQTVRKFNMSFSNAQREARRLQDQLDKTRGICDHSDTCNCTGYVEGNTVNQCGSCGDDISDHPALYPPYPPDVFRPVLDTLSKPYEITIAIYSHGCDKPLPLFERYPSEQHRIVSKVQMVSAVSHACFNYGTSESYLKMLQNVYRDKSVDQHTAFQRIKQHMNPVVRALQQEPHYLDVHPNERQYRDKFLSLPEKEIYRIHKPSTDREYNFVKYESDVAEKKEFGIYILHSTLPDDDIEFSYENPIDQLSQRNNILSPHVSPSLQRYSDILYNTMQVNPITIISLQDLLYCLFTRIEWDTVRIIDLGCRATCASYVADPSLRRLTSLQITDLENQAFGKKKCKKSKCKSKGKSKGKK